LDKKWGKGKMKEQSDMRRILKVNLIYRSEGTGDGR